MEKYKKLFKNSDGKVVIGQAPNIPILAWIILVIASMLTHGDIANLLQTLSRMVLFAWAYLEISQGKSMFRRLLGGVVALYLIGTVFLKGKISLPLIAEYDLFLFYAFTNK